MNSALAQGGLRFVKHAEKLFAVRSFSELSEFGLLMYSAAISTIRDLYLTTRLQRFDRHSAYVSTLVFCYERTTGVLQILEVVAYCVMCNV